MKDCGLNIGKGVTFFVMWFYFLSVNHIKAVDFQINTKGVHNDESEPFIPTKEWQVVKKGQQIPPGLHVRSNFQTGVVEAKLMDESEKAKSGNAAIVVKEGEKKAVGIDRTPASPKKLVNPDSNPSPHTTLSREQILAALKDVGKDDDVKNKKIVEEAKKAKFRSYDDLKKDFEKMKVNVRTDMEIIKELVVKLNNTNSTTETKISALTDLEYFLHQIDNAKDFADIHGLELLLTEMRNTDWRVRSEANFAIASALQSNAKVQIRAFELGLLSNLLHQVEREREAACLNRILFALSALLRNFPYAQLHFVRRGGLKALGSLFRDGERAQERLHVRMITLFTDLLTEKTSHEVSINRSDPMEVEKERQYRQVDLAQYLLKGGWCDLVPPLLTRVNDHDGREKVLKFLLASSNFCRPVKNGGRPPVELQGLLMQLNAEYVALAAQEVAEGETDGYFSGIRHLVQRVLDNTVPKRTTDEL